MKKNSILTLTFTFHLFPPYKSFRNNNRFCHFSVGKNNKQHIILNAAEEDWKEEKESSLIIHFVFFSAKVSSSPGGENDDVEGRNHHFNSKMINSLETLG